MLEFFFRHYESWVDRFYILDDGSTDGSLEYLHSREDVVAGAVQRADPSSWVASAKCVYDSGWKQSRGEADWTVVTNIDEHFHHRDMRSYLKRMLDTGVTVVPALGYQMLAEKWPDAGAVLWRDCPMGAPWVKMSKAGIFRPDRILETNFAPGRHTAAFEGDVVYPQTDDIFNLHYKYLGGLRATQARHEAQSARLEKYDLVRGWGHKYRWSIAELGKDFEQFRSELVDTRTVDPHTQHGAPRWWSSARCTWQRMATAPIAVRG